MALTLESISFKNTSKQSFYASHSGDHKLKISGLLVNIKHGFDL